MASKTFKFKGKAVYAKPYAPDEYNGERFWKIGLAPTKEELQRIKDSGCQLRAKFAENIPGIDDGTKFVTFKRPTQKQFRDELVFFCSPQIIDKSNKVLVGHVDEKGKLVTQYKEGEDRPERKGDIFAIGNRSDIEVTVEIYPAGSYGKGTRLNSVKIIDLIEYHSPDEQQSEETSEDDEASFDTDDEAEVEKKVEAKKESRSSVKVGW